MIDGMLDALKREYRKNS